ncbi:MAG: hypothetical protein ACREMH_02320, partial [Gemmatimonadales bacterium]
MFIELTDLLRCPAPHPESYLVLLPDAMAGRDVLEGRLGCPACGAEYLVREGRAELGEARPQRETAPSRLEGDGILALLGLDGPGGFVALVGGAAAAWPHVTAGLEGVHLVGVNPPAGVRVGRAFSVVEAGRLPFKARSLRGVVLGPGYGDDPAWVSAAAQAVLPGLRVAGEGSGEG